MDGFTLRVSRRNFLGSFDFGFPRIRYNPDMAVPEFAGSLETLTGELKNFQEIAKYIRPSAGEIPTLNGIDVY